MKQLKLPRWMPVLLCALFCVSCSTISLDIALKKDGSGTVRVEYRVQKEFAAFAAARDTFADDESLAALPLSRSDFENAARAVPGLTLKSYKRTEDEKDYIYTAAIHFKTITALAAYLSPAGGGQYAVQFEERGGTQELRFNYWQTFAARAPGAQSTAELVRLLFAGCTFNLNMRLPAKASVLYVDTHGAPVPDPPFTHSVARGKTYSMSAPMADLFLAEAPAALVVRWQGSGK
ncbi:MAG: hypothetical protein LBC72_02515 [Spirochaetaceae bacterium]|nr:hypothetical protein [Spirochaetaceae bacterium]